MRIKSCGSQNLEVGRMDYRTIRDMCELSCNYLPHFIYNIEWRSEILMHHQEVIKLALLVYFASLLMLYKVF